MKNNKGVTLTGNETKELLELAGITAAGAKIFKDGVQYVDSSNFWKWFTTIHGGGRFYGSVETLQNYIRNHTKIIETGLQAGGFRARGFEWEVFKNYHPHILDINKLPKFNIDIPTNVSGKDVISFSPFTGKMIIECKTGIAPGTIQKGAEKLFSYDPNTQFAVNESIYKKAIDMGMSKDRFVIVIPDEKLKDIGEKRFQQLVNNGATAGITISEVIQQVFQGAVIGAVIYVGVSTISNYKSYRNNEITGKDFAKRLLKDSAKGGVMGSSLAAVNLSVQMAATTLGVAAPVTIPVMIVIGYGLKKVIDPIFKDGEYAEVLRNMQYHDDIMRGWVNFGILSCRLFETQEIFVSEVKKLASDFRKLDQIDNHLNREIVKHLKDLYKEGQSCISLCQNLYKKLIRL